MKPLGRSVSTSDSCEQPPRRTSVLHARSQNRSLPATDGEQGGQRASFRLSHDRDRACADGPIRVLREARAHAARWEYCDRIKMRWDSVYNDGVETDRGLFAMACRTVPPIRSACPGEPLDPSVLICPSCLPHLEAHSIARSNPLLPPRDGPSLSFVAAPPSRSRRRPASSFTRSYLYYVTPRLSNGCHPCQSWRSSLLTLTSHCLVSVTPCAHLPPHEHPLPYDAALLTPSTSWKSLSLIFHLALSSCLNSPKQLVSSLTDHVDPSQPSQFLPLRLGHRHLLDRLPRLVPSHTHSSIPRRNVSDGRRPCRPPNFWLPRTTNRAATFIAFARAARLAGHLNGLPYGPTSIVTAGHDRQR